MNSKKFSEALGKIDEKYIDEVLDYSVPLRRKNDLWKILAACVAVIIAAVGIVPQFINKSNNYSFVLTAYAAEKELLVESIMQEGQAVPVSFFETESGLRGFVFSYDDREPKTYSTFSIMSESNVEEHIEEIAGLEQKLGKHYIYYVPDQSKTAPYKFMIPYTDEEANIIYFCYLLVEESEEGYSAVIEKYEQFERRFKE